MGIKQLFLFAALCVSASAFVPAPARGLTARPRIARSATPVRPTMALDALPAVDISSAAHDTVSSITLAASANDFGGYTFPVVGLLLLVGVIVSLSPPLAD
jgi:hypothetical protein